MNPLMIVAIMVAAAAIFMLIKWPGAFFGFIYCVGMALLLYWLLLKPIQKTTEDLKIFAAVTLGIGAVFGAGFAKKIHNGIKVGDVIGGILLIPVLMFLLGAVLLFGIAFVQMMIDQSDDAIKAALLWVALIAGFAGGPGAIIMIIFDN